MARWVKMAKAFDFGGVWNKVLRIGENAWRNRMVTNASGAATYARYASGTAHSGKNNIEVDVDNTNVRV